MIVYRTPQPIESKEMKIKYGRNIGFVLIAFLMSACEVSHTLSGGAETGKVVDMTTSKPIPDAIVVVEWTGHLGYSGTFCLHAATTKSDEHGKYIVPGWVKESKYSGATDRDVYVAAYKPGYTRSDKYEKDIIYLQPFTGTREERLEYLEKVARTSSCHLAGESERSLFPLYEAVYDEAKALVRTQEDQETLAWIRDLAASVYLALPPDTPSSQSDKMRKEFLKDHLK